MRKIYLIKPIEERDELARINKAISEELIKAKLGTYKGSPVNYSKEIVHPDGSKVYIVVNLDKVPEQKKYKLRHLKESDLEELDESWYQETSI